MAITPRPYQLECVQSIVNYFAEGGRGNPLVALPTGTGKSLIPPLLMQWALQQWPNQRMVLLTHVQELIEQNHKALQRLWPAAPVGVYSAGLGLKEAYAPLVFGGIASVKNAIYELGHRDLMFIDEAHLLSPNESSMYQQVIAAMHTINPHMRIIGLSATPFRMGQGMLTDGGLFTDVVYDLTGVDAFNRLIDECYLSPLVPKPTSVVIDVSDVRQLSNDFNQGDLCQAIVKQNITRRALEEAYYVAADRKSWIVFGAGIENCESITAILNSMGVPACYVHSKMDREQRTKNIEGFKNGYFRAIVSNNILTTGFDHPQTDCIIDLRPTISVVLHVQKYGRGTRPYFHPMYNFEHLRHLEYRKAAIEAGGKRNCIVLDFAGNTNRLGPINDPRIPRKKGKGTGEVPIKLCQNCSAYNHISARFCCDCGQEFIFKVKIKAEASTAEIIRRNSLDIEILDITHVSKQITQKAGKTPKLKVSYYHQWRVFNMWLAFEDKGLPLHKAHEWWRQHKGDDFPLTVQEAFDRFSECRQARQMRVETSTGEYPQIAELLF